MAVEAKMEHCRQFHQEPGLLITVIRHRAGAPSLRLGLGPGLRPVDAIGQLQKLLNCNSFWATARSRVQLRTMLKGSSVVVSAWSGQQLVGFGRANSDGVFRAVLWDVVVAEQSQGQGLGRQLVEALLAAPALAQVERTYLMTTNCEGFYRKLGFNAVQHQRLMRREASGQ
jgi:N-acetylglutamate synthase-like GNAT family acetyltransferase